MANTMRAFFLALYLFSIAMYPGIVFAERHESPGDATHHPGGHHMHHGNPLWKSTRDERLDGAGGVDPVMNSIHLADHHVGKVNSAVKSIESGGGIDRVNATLKSLSTAIKNVSASLGQVDSFQSKELQSLNGEIESFRLSIDALVTQLITSKGAIGELRGCRIVEGAIVEIQAKIWVVFDGIQSHWGQEEFARDTYGFKAFNSLNSSIASALGRGFDAFCPKNCSGRRALERDVFPYCRRIGPADNEILVTNSDNANNGHADNADDRYNFNDGYNADTDNADTDNVDNRYDVDNVYTADIRYIEGIGDAASHCRWRGYGGTSKTTCGGHSDTSNITGSDGGYGGQGGPSKTIVVGGGYGDTPKIIGGGCGYEGHGNALKIIGGGGYGGHSNASKTSLSGSSGVVQTRTYTTVATNSADGVVSTVTTAPGPGGILVRDDLVVFLLL
ncbi:hypothetical protein GGS23DRAFT_620973 [Durotheca rogersii]|uniref:uncharacterized protein n=1 Tax=Durotheca rogersii TaxID=419775 RepID=UPI00221F4F11|nr:uncharacterized protein GGS23DRAFT_620973 [Durotheca rogersii]KAI5863345.1 hypothetical protein GGS23DRAFT_620973 [Durotheca rogersii]